MERLLRNLVVGLLGLWLVLGPSAADAQDGSADPTAEQNNGASEYEFDDGLESPAGEAAQQQSGQQNPETDSSADDAASSSRTATGRQRRAEPMRNASATPVAGRAALTTGGDDGDDPTGKLEIDDAVLRWGINNESNTRAFAPGTFNFMSAGKLGDPGQGAQLLPARGDGSSWMNGKRAGWSAAAGNVSLQKWDGSAFRPATFAGTSTDSDGNSLRNGTFSNHQLVFSKGKGEIDLAAKTATIKWTGDATILYYSGYAFFYLSDPELVVSDGAGKVTAVLGGFSTSMDDMSKWEPVRPTRVTIADLGAVTVTKAGFTSTPKFEGVRVSGDGISQVAPYGSFPQSFINFQNQLGTAAYWYTSGGSADRHKAALPMTFAWQGNPAQPPAPSPGPPPEEIINPVLTPPRSPAATTTIQNIVNQTPAASGTPNAIAASARATRTLGATSVGDLSNGGQLTTLSASVASGSTKPVLWWSLAAVFVALALLSLVTSYAYTRALAAGRR